MQDIRETEFYQAFINEYVSIITDMETKDVVTTDEEHIEKTSPVVVQGFVVDIDNDYIYVGTPETGISSAVLRKTGNIVTISKPQDLFDDVLDDMPHPTGKDFN